MQALAAPTVSKPFVAAAPRAPRSVRALAVAPRAAADEQPAAVSRRALAGLLAAVPVLLPASRALALIPDDDDEELVEKARANRAKRLASERQTEQAFTRSGDKIGGCLGRLPVSLGGARVGAVGGCHGRAVLLPGVAGAAKQRSREAGQRLHLSRTPRPTMPRSLPVCALVRSLLLQTACWSMIADHAVSCCAVPCRPRAGAGADPCAESHQLPGLLRRSAGGGQCEGRGCHPQVCFGGHSGSLRGALWPALPVGLAACGPSERRGGGGGGG